ncbi:MAG: lasso RiPP family leader peptide-containing protein [Bacteroidia bacterium]
MKTINLHATTTKKSYRKPVLKKIGTIKKLTRGGVGGSTDEEFTQKAGG